MVYIMLNVVYAMKAVVAVKKGDCSITLKNTGSNALTVLSLGQKLIG